MATTIAVSKKTVSQFLSSGAMKPFVIPEYQRPYAWEEEQIQTLFDDLWEFGVSTVGQENANQKTYYFLGCIVAFENDDGEREIIDGQQRITSLFLLLRAIYTKLKQCSPSKTVLNCISKIEPTIWREGNTLEGTVDYTSSLLTSKVVNDKANGILKSILETGIANPDATDNYSKNYRKFQEYLKQKGENDTLHFFYFILALLNQAIVLPIEADSQDTALTIFSTLNDRGLPLSDADIFKAKMYNQAIDEENRQDFIDFWKNLDEQATYVSENIQQLFYYYMFYLRAKEKDSNTTTPGLRKYYSANKFEKLSDSQLLDNLMTILNLWQVVNNHESIQGEHWSDNQKIRQALSILNSYPNEYWKYPVIIYYLQHRTKPNFEESFLCFLHKLIVELMTRYLKFPTVSAVKAGILKLNIDAMDNLYPKFDLGESQFDELKKNLLLPHPNMVRMLLKILAYQKQDELLPEKWEIEHILPVHNDHFNFHDSNCIEHFGNKLPFEKRLNIIATNGYFAQKQKAYRKSNIQITKDMGELPEDQWDDKCILQRDEELANAIVKIFQRWNDEYAQKQA